MNDNEGVHKTTHNGNQGNKPSETKSLDVIVNMDITTDTKEQISNDCENIVSTGLRTEKNDVVTEYQKNDNDIKKQNVGDKSPGDQYITVRVLETYYGQQQQPQKFPHQQQQFQRHPLRQRDDTGGRGYYAPEPLTYEPGVRNAFIKLVFGILLIMILVTSIFIAFVLATPDVRRIFRRYSIMFFILGLLLLLICHYAMFLSPCARVPPFNIILLIVAVIAYCILAGNISARYKTNLVLYAALATTAVVLVCLLLACTRFDFTSFLLYVVVIATVFAVISAIVMVSVLVTRHYPKPLHICMLVIGTLIQVVMLIIELQMILGGKSIELSEQDYALGAFMLYTSIMSLFMNMLQLLGLSQ